MQGVGHFGDALMDPQRTAVMHADHMPGVQVHGDVVGPLPHQPGVGLPQEEDAAAIACGDGAEDVEAGPLLADGLHRGVDGGLGVRAALAELGDGQVALFISGTASIVGHDTVHPGDVAAQCRETVRNLGCLVDEANRVRRSQAPFSLGGLSHRAYVRHAADAATVQQTLTPLLQGAPLVLVQADICRADLLVEIECQAIQPLTA